MKKLFHKICISLFRFFKGSYVLTMHNTGVSINHVMILGVFKSRNKATQYMKNFDYSFGRPDLIVSIHRDMACDDRRYVLYSEKVGSEIVGRSCFFAIEWGSLNGKY